MSPVYCCQRNARSHEIRVSLERSYLGFGQATAIVQPKWSPSRPFVTRALALLRSLSNSLLLFRFCAGENRPVNFAWNGPRLYLSSVDHPSVRHTVRVSYDSLVKGRPPIFDKFAQISSNQTGVLLMYSISATQLRNSATQLLSLLAYLRMYVLTVETVNERS